MSNANKTVYKKFIHLIGMIRRNLYGRQADPILDKTKGQGRVLAILKIKSEITTKDLVFLMGISQQSLNELLIRLENNGYIERVPSDKDKRVKVIRLTEKGKEVDQDSYGSEEVFSTLTEKEITDLDAILDKVIDHMEHNGGKDTMDEQEDEFFERMERMRASMTEEDFEKLIKMRGGMGDFGSGRGFENFGGFGGFFGRENPWKKGDK